MLYRAHDEQTHGNIYVATSNENIPADVFKQLRKQGRTALVQAETQRDRARVACPKKLDHGQTLTVQDTEGLSLQFDFFRIELRRWANVTLRFN